MAECTAYSAIIVSNSTPTLDGTYVPYSTTTISGEVFTSYTKDGLDSFPRIQAVNIFSSNYIWRILTSDPSGGGSSGPSYNSSTGVGSGYYSTLTPLNCPNEVEIWIPFDAPSSVTVTGVAIAPSSPTFGLPAETVALITKNFGTVENFLRLRNQGQV